MSQAGADLPLRPWSRALLLIGAGGLAALSLPPICFVPTLALGLFVLLRFAESAAGWRGAALYGFWFGLGFHTLGLYWITNAILTRVADFWWLVPFASPGCALILAPFAALPAVACRWVRPGWPRITMFAGMWTLLDMSRVYLFSGFPWNPLGSIWEWPGQLGDVLIQPASVIGVDGLTLLSVLLALGLWQGRRGLMLVVLALALWTGFGVWRIGAVHPLTRTNPVVVLVQGNVSEADKLGRSDDLTVFRRYLDLTHEGVARARARYPDRAIAFAWPETAYPGLLEEDGAVRQLIMRAADGALYGMVGSIRTDEAKHWFNSVIALNAQGAVVGTYDKSTLVPFGEYRPWILPFNLVPGQLTPGSGRRTWHLPGIGGVGPLVCYEVIFSSRVVQPNARPDWLLNVTNDAWYGDSAGPRQHLLTARMRAVEEGLPIARAANTGISVAFGPTGHELERLGWGHAGSLVVDLPQPLPPTLFAQAGRTIPVALSVLCCVLALVFGRRGILRL